MYFRRKFSEAEHRRFDNWTHFLTLRIVCGTGSIKRSGVRPSISQSVPSVKRSSGFVAEHRMCKRYRLTAPGARQQQCRSPALSSKCGQRHVDSRINEAEHRQFQYLQSRRFSFARTSGHVTLSLRMRETATG